MNSNNDQENEEFESDKSFIKKVLRRHTKAAFLFFLGGILIFVEAIFVSLWWVDNFNEGKAGSTFKTFNELTLGNIIVFSAIFIILLFLAVGIGFLLLGIEFKYLWWNRLSEEERAEIHDRKSVEMTHEHRRWKRGGYDGRWGRRKEGGGFGFFIFLTFLAVVLYDGNFDATFGTFGWDYWFFSWLKAVVLMAVVWSLIYLGYALWLLRQPDESI